MRLFLTDSTNTLLSPGTVSHCLEKVKSDMAFKPLKEDFKAISHNQEI